MVLELKNLSKTYGNVQALKEISYSFKPGIYGILGSNGAGKSTMINLITDNISRDTKHDGGQILFNGKDILKLGREFRKLVGYMPQQQGFYEDFSPRTFLRYIAEMKGIKSVRQIDELLDIVNLTSAAHKKIGGFSGGMRQRVLLAQALLGNPQILILDEPTAGLDPKERISIRNYISELSRDKIILFATHVVSDIECIADRILLLKKGEIVVEGAPEQLIQSISGKVGELLCTAEKAKEYQIKYKISNMKQCKGGNMLRLIGDSLPEESVPVEDGIGLEDVFLYYCD